MNMLAKTEKPMILVIVIMVSFEGTTLNTGNPTATIGRGWFFFFKKYIDMVDSIPINNNVKERKNQL
jgi:hypothetical protein